MYLINDCSNNELSKMFGTTAERFRGYANGWILKYDTFYIKIYREDYHNDYVMKHYHWGNDIPFRVDVVPSERIGIYAKEIQKSR